MYPEYEDFLTSLGAKEVKHSGRTLWDHLKGTYDILEAWKCPEHVCRAGLFHSIYGTEYFKHACLSLDQRNLLRRLIGKDAEQLAYEFCTTPRKDLRAKELEWIAGANAFEQSFERCWPWLESALDMYAYKHDGVVLPTHRKEHVLAEILSGKCFFWPGKKCAAVTRINESPNRSKDAHTLACGWRGE